MEPVGGQLPVIVPTAFIVKLRLRPDIRHGRHNCHSDKTHGRSADERCCDRLRHARPARRRGCRRLPEICAKLIRKADKLDMIEFSDLRHQGRD
jgi:hypothetical protein